MEWGTTRRVLLSEVFGDSSSSSGSEEDDENQTSAPLKKNPNPSWEHVSGINGLWLCRDFLSPHLQSSLLSAIHNEGWFTQVSHNQAMRFGDLPAWATELSSSIRELVHSGDFGTRHLGIECSADAESGASSPPSPIFLRDPLFDQLIVNVYQPGEGICAHVDLMRFDDGIAIVSLESPCVMHFTKAAETCEAKGDYPKTEKLPVHLTPGSLVLMWGEARYLWTHEINRKPGFQVWEGQEIHQKKRTSVTLRKLRPTD